MNDINSEEADRRDSGVPTATEADAAGRPTLNGNLELRPSARELQRAAHVEAIPATEVDAVADQRGTPLFSSTEAKEWRIRWDTIQADFVDEPRRAVESADRLVAESMKRLAEIFAAERAKLDGQWDHQDNVSTENLRLALCRYRSFFGRLLSI